MSCSKPVFLRQEWPEKAESFFCLISCSLFSILSIWPLTFINQSILIFLPRFPFKSYSLIICCNVLLKVNSISSEILLMFLQYKMFSSQPNSLASVSIICISPKQHYNGSLCRWVQIFRGKCWYNFYTFLLIHRNNEVIKYIICTLMLLLLTFS